MNISEALRGVDPQTLFYHDIRLMPKNDEELYNWIRGYFGWQLARWPVCEDHDAPLTVLSDLVFERVLDVIILANRNGGKTLVFAIANLADSLFKSGCEIASVGAILAQAKKCFLYYRDMLENRLLIEEATYMTEGFTKLKNGSEVRVLPGTMTGTNCLGGDTVIDTLSGKSLLRELIGQSGFWVHGYDVERRRWTVGEVERVWEVGVGSTVKVTHEGGVVLVSMDHPVLLLNGEWRCAGDLKFGDGLMSLDGKQAVNHRVVSVEEGPDIPLYDMTVKGCHTFVANGTVVSNSPHPHKARADEVDLIDWDVLQQFFSMARSSRGILAQNVLGSTRKTLKGSMQRLMDKMRNDPSFPFELRTWCILDTLARNPQGGPDCPCRKVVRSGDHKSFYDTCRGRCKNADGFYDYRDAWRKFAMLEPEVWDSEWECLRPSRTSVVYKDMEDERIRTLLLDPTRETWACCDFGFTHPFAFYICQNDTMDNVYVMDEIYKTGLEPSSMVRLVVKLFDDYGLQRDKVTIYPDPRGSAEVAELRKAGFKMKPRAIEIQAGVNWVKMWVRGKGHPKLFIDGARCPNLKWEMSEGYQYREGTEMPEDANNHGCDSIRYGICGRYPIRASGFGNSSAEAPRGAGDGRKRVDDIVTARQSYGGIQVPTPRLAMFDEPPPWPVR